MTVRTLKAYLNELPDDLLITLDIDGVRYCNLIVEVEDTVFINGVPEAVVTLFEEAD